MLLMVFIAKGIKLSLADVKINTLQCAQRTSCGTHQGHGVSGHRCKEIVVQDVMNVTKDGIAIAGIGGVTGATTLYLKDMLPEVEPRIQAAKAKSRIVRS